MLLKAIEDGSALKKLSEMVAAQGGRAEDVYDTSALPQAKIVIEAKADADGYVNHIEAEKVGLLCMHLGGGRETKESEIDLSVGVVLHKKVGDRVNKGDSIATIYASDTERANSAARMLHECYEISDSPVVRPPFIKAIIK